MPKIFIATPAYQGTVHACYALALNETTQLLAKYSIDYSVHISSTSTMLVAERNHLLAVFLKSDATHILCIDSDLAWPATAVKDFLDFDEEFIAGVYPSRRNHTYYCKFLKNADGSLKRSEKNLIEATAVPAGFMLIKRSAIEKMIEYHPELRYSYDDAFEEYCLFNTEVKNGKFQGEDYVFCSRACAADIKIWIDPLVEFDHAGVKGMFMDALIKHNFKF